MTRRAFLQRAGIGAVALSVHGCAGPASAREATKGSDAARLGDVLGDQRMRILATAARAPSSHNVQPWRVNIHSHDEWTIGANLARRLPIVDPSDRELALSLGAFLEYLCAAAEALGSEASPQVIDGAHPSAGEVIRVKLGRAAQGAQGVERLGQIGLRRTLRKGYTGKPLSTDDLAALTGALGTGARWFPRGSQESDRLATCAVESFRQQTASDSAQAELARWTRFADSEVERTGDGLTPRTMEVGGVAGFYMRHFMDAGSVMGKQFRDAGIDAVAEQARQGAGWLVLPSPDESVASLVEAGRRFARMALLLRDRRLAAHPMSQVLEEEPWRSTIAKGLGVDGKPQFVLRVGYVEDYPKPVSRRRPVSAFASLA